MFNIGDRVKLIRNLENEKYMKEHYGSTNMYDTFTVIENHCGSREDCVRLSVRPMMFIRHNRLRLVNELPEELFTL